MKSTIACLRPRIVGIWFAMELGAVVLPFIMVPTPESVGFALDGLEGCSVVAFGTMGYVKDPRRAQRHQ